MTLKFEFYGKTCRQSEVNLFAPNKIFRHSRLSLPSKQHILVAHLALAQITCRVKGKSLLISLLGSINGFVSFLSPVLTPATATSINHTLRTTPIFSCLEQLDIWEIRKRGVGELSSRHYCKF